MPCGAWLPIKYIQEDNIHDQQTYCKYQENRCAYCSRLRPNAELHSKADPENAYKEFGETLEGAAEAIWQFNKGIVDATYDLIPAVKPQIAMYEQFGLPGLAAYKRTIDYCKEKNLVVIGDIKRGDIGSTSAAYATAHLGKIQIGSKTYAPFDENFATVTPYLGTDGVKPFVDAVSYTHLTLPTKLEV